MTTTETETQLTRAETAALLGGAGGILAGVSHFSGNSALTWLACALLGVAAAMGMSAGWFVGLTPRPAAAPASLVGTRVAFGGGVYMVIDDSAVHGDGRRASVVATDESGTVGILFVGFDSDGAVAEARIGDGVWGAAQVVG